MADTFEYQRQNDFQEPSNAPLIRTYEVLGELKDIRSDPPYVKNRTYPFFNRVFPSISMLSERTRNIHNLDLKDYKEEVQEKKRQQYIREPYKDILKIVSDERQAVKNNVTAFQLTILNYSNPRKPKDPLERQDYNEKLKELRQVLRSMDMQERIDKVQTALDKENSIFLSAVIDAPDELIEAKTLNEIRREHALKRNPTWKQCEQDLMTIADTTERRCKEVLGTSAKILQLNNLDMPLSKEEFYTYFPSEDSFENSLRERQVEKEKHEQFINESRKRFEEQNVGINI